MTRTCHARKTMVCRDRNRLQLVLIAMGSPSRYWFSNSRKVTVLLSVCGYHCDAFQPVQEGHRENPPFFASARRYGQNKLAAAIANHSVCARRRGNGQPNRQGSYEDRTKDMANDVACCGGRGPASWYYLDRPGILAAREQAQYTSSRENI
jgi:hypothetical protein